MQEKQENDTGSELHRQNVRLEKMVASFFVVRVNRKPISIGKNHKESPDAYLGAGASFCRSATTIHTKHHFEYQCRRSSIQHIITIQYKHHDQHKKTRRKKKVMSAVSRTYCTTGMIQHEHYAIMLLLMFRAFQVRRGASSPFDVSLWS